MMPHLPNCPEQYYLRLHFPEICYSFSCSFPPIKGICSLSYSEVSTSLLRPLYVFLQGFNPSPLIHCLPLF